MKISATSNPWIFRAIGTFTPLFFLSRFFLSRYGIPVPESLTVFSLLMYTICPLITTVLFIREKKVLDIAGVLIGCANIIFLIVIIYVVVIGGFLLSNIN